MEFDGINSVIKHKSFNRDLKKLKKRFKTLDEDLEYCDNNYTL